MNHEIFSTPHAVQPTLEERTTPSEYFRTDASLGNTMPMWRVQTEGYQDPQGQLIGMVARDAGFLDSPDTEWISSGVNSKGPQAVAIGRHGNMFLWGFAASPTYLTDEAKLVFINSVHYIAQFNGQAPIARKRQGTAMRSYVRQAVAGLSAESFAERLAYHQKSVASYKDDKAAIRVRINAGEDVPESDRRFLDMKLPSPPGLLDSVKRYVSEDKWASLKDDAAKVEAHLRGNLPYMRSQGWYELVVDEELKKFGVANNDIALLEKAIAMLVAKDTDRVTAEQAQQANALLERYTDQSFATGAAWQSWFTQNRNRLFFTEAGGYKWLVDSTDQAEAAKPEAVDVGTPEAETIEATATDDTASDLEPDDNEPVASRLKVKAIGENRFALTLQVKILDGWHAYGSIPQGSAYVPMTVDLRLPKGFERHGEWQLPQGTLSVETPGLTTVEGDLTYRCELRGSTDGSGSSGEVACTLSYQVCDDSSCLMPTSTTVVTSLPE